MKYQFHAYNIVNANYLTIPYKKIYSIIYTENVIKRLRDFSINNISF